MTKYRLYGEDMRPHGTLDWINQQEISLSSTRNSELFIEFVKVVKKFLVDNKLKLVSQKGSKKPINNDNPCTKCKSFDIYSKSINSRTQKTELIKIEKEVNDKNGKRI